MIKRQLNKKVVLAIIATFFTGAALITTVFGWFALLDVRQSLIFTTGSLESEVEFYMANDPNYDGMFLEEDYVIKTDPIVMENVVSGQIFSFKLVIRNVGNIPGELTVTLKEPLFLDGSDNPSSSLKEAYSFGYSDIGETNYQHTYDVFPNSDTVFGYKNRVSNLDEDVVIYFQIIVTKKLTNTYYNHTLKIPSIEVRLDQLRP